MQAIATVDRSLTARRSSAVRHKLVSSCPPTAADSAVASVRWERRGLLGRLLRLDVPPAGRR